MNYKKELQENNLKLDQIKDTLVEFPDYIDTSDATIEPYDVMNGEIAYGADGKIFGTAPFETQNTSPLTYKLLSDTTISADNCEPRKLYVENGEIVTDAPKTGQYVWEKYDVGYKLTTVPQQTMYFTSAGTELQTKTIYYSADMPEYNINTGMWEFTNYQTCVCSNQNGCADYNARGKYFMIDKPYGSGWRLMYDMGAQPNPNYTYMFKCYVSYTDMYSDTTTKTFAVANDTTLYPADGAHTDGYYYHQIMKAEEVAW